MEIAIDNEASERMRNSRRFYSNLNKFEKPLTDICRRKGWKLINFDGRKHFYAQGKPEQYAVEIPAPFWDKSLSLGSVVGTIEGNARVTPPKVTINIDYFEQLKAAKEIGKLLEENHCEVTLMKKYPIEDEKNE